MDENGVRQFLSTVVENMLTGVGKTVYFNSTMNTNQAYVERVSSGGKY
jgi:hypothetical protein